MTNGQEAFPSRLLHVNQLESLESVAPDAQRINRHIENGTEATGPMSEEDVEQLLHDPMATLVLRQGVFPNNLTELIEALDRFDAEPAGLPGKSAFLISEGGQIPFEVSRDKGGSRLILVRSRGNSPELMISTLVPAGGDPRVTGLLLEVLTWDPVNETFHFYQRQSDAWFWCGQSDMALVAPTRGHGPFDSHVNGYPLMKELKTPWVHWHSPALSITEDAFAPDDPLMSDPLVANSALDHALNFEISVIRPLCERWNDARFAKAGATGVIAHFDQYVRQVVGSSTANLISTHTEWSQVATQPTGTALGDLPTSFFVDIDSFSDVLGLSVSLPTLTMAGATYVQLAEKYDLRVRDGDVDIFGDVPFCFLVPERAFEDVLALKKLVQTGCMSRRQAACLLMVDFTNPLFSPTRRSLREHFPPSVQVGDAAGLETAFESAARDVASDNPAIAEFLANWDLGPIEWEAVFTGRINSYLSQVAQRLQTESGADDIFRLAESRRREFDLRPLAEFDLSLPQSAGIPQGEPFLEMTVDGNVRPRALQEVQPEDA